MPKKDPENSAEPFKPSEQLKKTWTEFEIKIKLIQQWFQVTLQI